MARETQWRWQIRVMGTSVPRPSMLGDVIVYIEPGENDAQRDQGHGPEQPCILDFQPCTHHQIGNRLPGRAEQAAHQEGPDAIFEHG